MSGSGIIGRVRRAGMMRRYFYPVLFFAFWMESPAIALPDDPSKSDLIREALLFSASGDALRSIASGRLRDFPGGEGEFVLSNGVWLPAFKEAPVVLSADFDGNGGLGRQIRPERRRHGGVSGFPDPCGSIWKARRRELTLYSVVPRSMGPGDRNAATCYSP